MTAEAGLARRPLVAADALRVPLLLVLGALLGLWGALLVPAGPRVASHVLSAGAALAVVGNPVAARLALRVVPRFGGGALVAGWLAVAIVVSMRRANGSVVLPGSGDLAVPALVFVVGGLIAGALAAVVRTGR